MSLSFTSDGFSPTKLVRSLAMVTSGTLGAQLLSLVALPVLSRLYTPSEFTVWAIFLSANALVTSIATARYEQSIVLPKQDGDGATLVCGSVIIGTTVVAVLAVVLALWGHLLLVQLPSTNRYSWQLLLPATVWTNMVYNVAQAWYTRIGNFRYYAAIQICWALVTVVVQVCLGIAGTGGMGLVIGSFAGYAVATALFSLPVLSFAWRQYRQCRPGAIGENLWRFRNYPLFITPYTLVGTFRDRLVYFLLGAGPVSGFYSLAWRFLNAPNSFVAGILRPIVFRTAATVGISELGPVVASAMQMLVSAVLPFWLMFLVFAKPMVVLAFGREWEQAALYAQIISFPAVTLLFGNWLDRVFDVAGRQRFVFMLEAGFSIAAVAALAIGLRFGGPLGGIISQAAVVTVYHCVWLVKVWHIVRPGAEAAARVLRSAVLAVVVPGMVFLLVSIGFGDRGWPVALVLGGLFVLWRSRRQIQFLLIHRNLNSGTS